MQRSMLVSLLIFGLFSNVCAQEPTSAITTEKGQHDRENSLAAAPLKSPAVSLIHPEVAAAQPTYQITLYGIADLDVTFSRNKKDSDAPTTTVGNWNGSRLGLKGNEELGNELKALFQLESGFGLNDGSLKQGGRLFGRQAYVGLESKIGTVTLGRQYSASDAVASIVDIAAPGSFVSAYKSQFYQNLDRLDNTLMYSSPRIYGFQGFLGNAFDKKTDTTSGSTLTTGLLYNQGPLTAGIAFDSWRTAAFTTSATNYNFWNLAASYNFGAVELVAGFSADDVNQDISSTTAVKSKTYAVGAKLPVGAAGKAVLLLQAITPDYTARPLRLPLLATAMRCQSVFPFIHKSP